MQCRGTPANRRRQGFTFAEILAAMVFMAILIPVVMEGVMLANRASVVAERKALAAQLAEYKLNELIVTGEWQMSRPQGDFGEDWPGFRWTLAEAPWAADSLTELSVYVLFDVQGREYHVQLTTLVDESAL